MKIGLYDVDSIIPNLALMKISAYYRARGDDVELYLPIFIDDYDKIYASKIFSSSDGTALVPERMEIGGTGWNKVSVLPPEIEQMQPDYTLYGYEHSLGFTQRGCRLKCSFCVVPEKEGAPKPNNTIEEIWQHRESKFIVLLDNDFFGNPQWSDRITELLKFDLKVCFSQGLNIRNLKLEQAEGVASVKFRNLKDTARQVYFAWDDPRHEKLIHRGIERCVEAGIKPSEMAFYVLIGYHSTEAEDLHRVTVLRNYGCDPFAMPYDRSFKYQRDFARWVNHKAIFKSVLWTDYKNRTRHDEIPVEQGDFFGYGVA